MMRHEVWISLPKNEVVDRRDDIGLALDWLLRERGDGECDAAELKGSESNAALQVHLRRVPRGLREPRLLSSRRLGRW